MGVTWRPRVCTCVCPAGGGGGAGERGSAGGGTTPDRGLRDPPTSGPPPGDPRPPPRAPPERVNAPPRAPAPPRRGSVRAPPTPSLDLAAGPWADGASLAAAPNPRPVDAPARPEQPSGLPGSPPRARPDQAAQMRAPLCLLLLVAHAANMIPPNRRKKQGTRGCGQGGRSPTAGPTGRRPLGQLHGARRPGPLTPPRSRQARFTDGETEAPGYLLSQLAQGSSPRKEGAGRALSLTRSP